VQTQDKKETARNTKQDSCITKFVINNLELSMSRKISFRRLEGKYKKASDKRATSQLRPENPKS
jgi:hypothetical protein